GVFGLLGAVLSALLIIVWWMLFSRAPWPERLGVFGLMAAAVIVTSRIIDISIAGAGMGMMFYFLAPTVMAFMLVVGLLAGQRLATGPRRAVIAVSILLGAGFWTLFRTGGVMGAGNSDFHWRWTPTPEERLLARTSDEPKLVPPPPVAAAAPEPAITPVAAVD